MFVCRIRYGQVSEQKELKKLFFDTVLPRMYCYRHVHSFSNTVSQVGCRQRLRVGLAAQLCSGADVSKLVTIPGGDGSVIHIADYRGDVPQTVRRGCADDRCGANWRFSAGHVGMFRKEELRKLSDTEEIFQLGHLGAIRTTEGRA